MEINTALKIPQIIVNDEAVNFKDGIKAIMEYKNWSRKDVAHYLKVSPETVRGWIGGRKPSNSILMALSYMVA